MNGDRWERSVSSGVFKDSALIGMDAARIPNELLILDVYISASRSDRQRRPRMGPGVRIETTQYQVQEAKWHGRPRRGSGQRRMGE